VLTSHIHQVWAFRTGAWLWVGNDSNYNHAICFNRFPFPSDLPAELKKCVRAEGEALDVVRKQVLNGNPDLTLTGLYNVLEALRANRPLSADERDVHDRGLVSLIRQHHDAIDLSVAQAYGWPAGLTEEDILARLVTLN
ncbi:MAG: class I SAM-dependent DNA methyltransferase, partial [Candidatus Dormibacteraeota bacterium]|nr:class I SAM-dependent DNA methyltransferase [Candidatus Dormibacteraeota bacterium]